MGIPSNYLGPLFIALGGVILIFAVCLALVLAQAAIVRLLRRRRSDKKEQNQHAGQH